MSPNRTKLVVATAWFLFWAMMVSVAVQDYARDDGNAGNAYWQPVLWESSSIFAATVLLLIQHHFTHPYDHLLARPARWLALQALCEGKKEPEAVALFAGCSAQSAEAQLAVLDHWGLGQSVPIAGAPRLEAA